MKSGAASVGGESTGENYQEITGGEAWGTEGREEQEFNLSK